MTENRPTAHDYLTEMFVELSPPYSTIVADPARTSSCSVAARAWVGIRGATATRSVATV